MCREVFLPKQFHLKQAFASVEKILQLQPETVLCFHGGMVDGNVPERLRDLLNRYHHSSAST